MSDDLKVILEHTTKILEGIDEIKQMKTENKIESKAEKENTEDVKFHKLDKASYHIGCQMAGWAFSPASQLAKWLLGCALIQLNVAAKIEKWLDTFVQDSQAFACMDGSG